MTTIDRVPIRRSGGDRARQSASRETMITWLLRLLLLVGTAAAWEGGVRMGLVDSFLFGSPAGIASEFLRVVESGALLRDTWATFHETVVGFAIGTIIGSVAGLLLWYSRIVARVLDPIMVALNGLPKIALAPLIVVWFGSGITSKIALAAFATFVVATINVYMGAQQADKDLVRLVRSLGGGKHHVFVKVVVPSTAPWMVSTLRLNIGIALLAALGGEFVASDVGLGHAAFTAGYLFAIDAVWVSIFMLMALAMLLYAAILAIERYMQRRMPGIVSMRGVDESV